MRSIQSKLASVITLVSIAAMAAPGFGYARTRAASRTWGPKIPCGEEFYQAQVQTIRDNLKEAGIPQDSPIYSNYGDGESVFFVFMKGTQDFERAIFDPNSSIQPVATYYLKTHDPSILANGAGASGEFCAIGTGHPLRNDDKGLEAMAEARGVAKALRDSAPFGMKD